jgi:hypothetical protein
VASPPRADSFSMVIVEDRAWTRRVPELGLQCDDREVPVNLPDTYDNWLAGIFMRQFPEPPSGEVAELEARVALAVGDGRLAGIISPDTARQPAIWFSIELAELEMVEVIARHPSWRPRMIHVRVPGWSLVLVRVAGHDGLKEWPGQERNLLKALGGPTPLRERWADIWRRHGAVGRYC